MSIRPLQYLLLLGLLLTGCRDFVVDAGDEIAGRPFRSFDVTVNEPFELRVGDEAFLADADMTVTFSIVLEDGRCALGGECEGPGWAGIVLDLSRGIGDQTQIVLQIPGLVATPYRLNDYVQTGAERFQLLSLLPYPSGDAGGNSDPYRATIVIDR